MAGNTNPRAAVSVDTDHLGPAANSYDSISKSLHTVLTNHKINFADLQAACGNDDTGQKVFTSIDGLKDKVVDTAQLLVDVTALTSDGIRDMRDGYEQAETDAELTAQGQNMDSNLPKSGPNPGGNNSHNNTNTSSNNGRNKH